MITVKHQSTCANAWKKIGIDLVNAVRNSYENYCEDPSARNRKNYMKWRLRIHLRCNGTMREELELADQEYCLGLHDEEVGQTFWDLNQG